MLFFLDYPALFFSLFRRILRSMNRTSWEPNFHSVAFHITPPICCSQILAALRCAFVTLVQRDQSEFKALFWVEKETFCGLLNYSSFCASYQCDPQLLDPWSKKRINSFNEDVQIWLSNLSWNTPPETKATPENRPSGKETSTPKPNHPFSGANCWFQGGQLSDHLDLISRMQCVASLKGLDGLGFPSKQKNGSRHSWWWRLHPCLGG